MFMTNKELDRLEAEFKNWPDLDAVFDMARMGLAAKDVIDSLTRTYHPKGNAFAFYNALSDAWLKKWDERFPSSI